MTQTTPRSGLSRFGTAAIAYLSLAVGAGLSTAFNVVHTIETRGAALDSWDIVVAVAGPGMVVLMVELFVSTLWAGQRWYMQAIRWLGCVMVAAIAMRMSWTHGHDFLASRGQTADVSALMPLAVDTLAIMATALLLSSRTLDTSKAVPDVSEVSTDKPNVLSKVMDTVDSMMVPGLDMSKVSTDTGTLQGYLSNPVSQCVPDTEGSMWDRLIAETDMSATVPPYVPGNVPVSPAPMGQFITRTVPGEDMDVAIAALLDRAQDMPELEMTVSSIKRDVSEVWGVTTKTVSRHMERKGWTPKA